MKLTITLFFILLLLGGCQPYPLSSSGCPLQDITVSKEAVERITTKYGIPKNDVSISYDKDSGMAITIQYEGAVYQIEEDVITKTAPEFDAQTRAQLTLYRDKACYELTQIDEHRFWGFDKKQEASDKVLERYIEKCLEAIGRTEEKSEKKPPVGELNPCYPIVKGISDKNRLTLSVESFPGKDQLLKLHFEPLDAKAAGSKKVNYGIERFVRLDGKNDSGIVFTRTDLTPDLQHLDLIVTVFLTKARRDEKLCSFEWNYN